MTEYRLLPAGDTALVVEFGESIDRDISGRVLSLAGRLRDLNLSGVVDIVPTFRSLMVHYEPIALSSTSLSTTIDKLIANRHGLKQTARHWNLPVCYDISVAPDLNDVAARTSLTPAQVVERHSATTYHVYMLGFLPGQAYLGDLATELALPRREAPRISIPAGSLAIAKTMTCIFPMVTPCGWHLIGRSPIPMWNKDAAEETLLAPGDKVTFKPISICEYETLQAQIATGNFVIQPFAESIEEAA